jgi:hypothetical protein
MNREIRNYIRQHGRTAARQRYGNIIDQEPINYDGRQVGTIIRHWHPVYCTWTWKATLTHDGTVYTMESLDSRNEVREWAENKITALLTPSFGPHLKSVIEDSGFTHVQVSEALGCSREVLFKWYNGQSYPGVHYLYRLGRLLDPGDSFGMYAKFSQMIDLEK